ncbi:PKD domain-containing protein [Filimonas effusa]|uniref:PKD domain-containing protein n=1 Tax=Filimonas effusa TaxID=2508721 RepID=A0A4Q1D5N6_9BACT|nr:PKD domain-containing protein [Filimonas effusa]RXK82937.1 PKD domain-containing protein [Filimonas effusa]
MRNCLLILLFITGSCAALKAQEPSNRGTDFWVGYGHHDLMDRNSSGTAPDDDQANTQEMVLYFSAEEAANVTVTVHNTTWKRTYHVPAHAVIASDYMPKGWDLTFIDCRLVNGGTNEGLYTNHGIHITSDVPVVAYSHTFAGGTSGATMLMPVNTWGYSYLSVNTAQNGPSGSRSYNFIVASEDNTVVEITPAVPTRGGRPAGQPFQVTLNKGDIYQVMGLNPRGMEMSGTRLTAVANRFGKCYPFGAFAGSGNTTNPMACSEGRGDLFVDADMYQLFPFQAWGTRYLTAPFSNSSIPARNQFTGYKIVVSDPTTVVKVNGTALNVSTLKNNFYYHESASADLIEADKPVMVAQLMGSGALCGGGSPTLNDPDILFISPVAQGINKIGFFRNNRQTIQVNYLTLIVNNQGTGLSSLRIDGQPLSAIPSADLYTYPHPRDRNYNVIVRRWANFPLFPATPPGQCLVYSDSSFTAVTYGLGPQETYSYNAGTHINNLHARSFIHNTFNTATNWNAFTCVNTPVAISALVAYKPTAITWKLSALAGKVSPAADVTVNNPAVAETVTIDGATFYKYTLPGSYSFNDADTFYLPVVLYGDEVGNCARSEEIPLRIIVRTQPKAGFSFAATSDCAADPVAVEGLATSEEGYELQKWLWTFPGGANAEGIKQSRKIEAGIDRPVSLRSITTDGCVADTTRLISLYEPPVADFTVSGKDVCENGTYTFTPSASYEGNSAVVKWYWDFGNGVTVEANSNAAQPANYTGAAGYTVKLVAKISDACVSDTAAGKVKIYANPKLNINFPQGCLPENGSVKFDNTTSTPDGQTVTGHAWNFGDGNANPANPNTATTASPSHIFTYGNYDVKYQATTEKGCVKDTLIKAVFNQAPTFVFDPLTAVCENAAPVSVAKASVTNGVSGTGVYKGNGTSATGIFNPAQAGPGKHEIIYEFTAASGCVATASRFIEVYAVPEAAFIFTDDICEGTEMSFTSSATAPAGESITRWQWNFDGTSKETAAALPVTFVFATHGAYQVKHIVTTAHGCISKEWGQTVHVRANPVAGFNSPEAICMPNGHAKFVNTTTVADNSALKYTWNFGDGRGASVEKDPSYEYLTGGNYNVKLSVISAYGCGDDASRLTNKFYDKPVASFTMNATDFCAGASVAFADKSTAPGSALSEWHWELGNGSISSEPRPSVRYSNSGTYSVSLTVKNAQGCVSNPFLLPVTIRSNPVIDAGPSFVVKAGTMIRFNASANANYKFLWDPAIGLSSAAVLQPSLTVTESRLYHLTATNEFDCSTTDSVMVELLKAIDPPNAFTPNGDGIHDLWDIPYLSDYKDAAVAVFNRYGQQVFRTKGYATPWNGKSDGKDLPAGTYYYIINLGTGGKPLTGAVTIIK